MISAQNVNINEKEKQNVIGIKKHSQKITAEQSTTNELQPPPSDLTNKKNLAKTLEKGKYQIWTKMSREGI